jgi:nucleoside-triphosphatase THEP1
MDELGFIESAASAFQNAVFAVLDGSVPVLGVIRKGSTPFLEKVKAHGNVSVVEVDTANRDKLPAWLTAQYWKQDS